MRTTILYPIKQLEEALMYNVSLPKRTTVAKRKEATMKTLTAIENFLTALNQYMLSDVNDTVIHRYINAFLIRLNNLPLDIIIKNKDTCGHILHMIDLLQERYPDYFPRDAHAPQIYMLSFYQGNRRNVRTISGWLRKSHRDLKYLRRIIIELLVPPSNGKETSEPLHRAAFMKQLTDSLLEVKKKTGILVTHAELLGLLIHVNCNYCGFYEYVIDTFEERLGNPSLPEQALATLYYLKRDIDHVTVLPEVAYNANERSVKRMLNAWLQAEIDTYQFP